MAQKPEVGFTGKSDHLSSACIYSRPQSNGMYLAFIKKTISQ